MNRRRLACNLFASFVLVRYADDAFALLLAGRGTGYVVTRPVGVSFMKTADGLRYARSMNLISRPKSGLLLLMYNFLPPLLINRYLSSCYYRMTAARVSLALQ